ncbi:MAG: ComF family protein [Candidatus Yanofskybacteria bacterium]|nr:ComF family protein [Candidatus Yanofskybacteria bacterium]
MSKLKHFLLDIFFPRHCLGCNILLSDVSGNYICEACLRGIKFTDAFTCAFCQSQVVNGTVCLYCRKDHFLDRLLVVTSYDNPLIKKITKNMKYRFVESLAEQVGYTMAKYIRHRLARGLDLKGAAIVPVPLHPKRLRWRGFNHAEVMAKTAGEELGIKVIPNLLKRVYGNKPQADMPDRVSRLGNIKTGAFTCHVPEAAENQRIILIDDLSTTGSTLDTCAYALKDAGASEVMGLVFARGKINPGT